MNAADQVILELVKPTLASVTTPRTASLQGRAATNGSKLKPRPPLAHDLSADKAGDDGRVLDATHPYRAVVSKSRASGSRRAKRIMETIVDPRDGLPIPERGGADANGRTSSNAASHQRQTLPERAVDEAKRLAQTNNAPPRPPLIRARAASKRASQRAEATLIPPASTKISGGGQNAHYTQNSSAVPAISFDDAQVVVATQNWPGVINEAETAIFASKTSLQAPSPLPPHLAKVVYNWRLKQRWHKAEKSLVLQAKALLRGLCDGDKTKAAELYEKTYAPFKRKRRPEGFDELSACAAAVGDDVAFALFPLIASVKQIETRREQIEKSLADSARELPIWPWVEQAHGFGALTLASIVGEAGDIGSYKSVSALWKRMGLAVVNGGRQRKVADAAGALEHGYSPPRRAVAYLLGQWLIMAGEKNPWRSVYTQRKEYELTRCEAIAADPELRKKYTRPSSDGKPAKYAPVAHANNRAARYMVKRVLRELYSAWRANERGEPMRAPGQVLCETQLATVGRAQLSPAED